jgi:hypothetical protein
MAQGASETGNENISTKGPTEMQIPSLRSHGTPGEAG